MITNFEIGRKLILYVALLKCIENSDFINSLALGCGGGLVVSVLAFYSDDPSSIPAEVYNFSVKLLLKRTKINKKRPGLAQFLKKTLLL